MLSNDDENLNPELKRSLDEGIEWIEQILELEREHGMAAILGAVDSLDEEQAKKICFCLLVSYAADARHLAWLIQNWQAAPLQ